MPKNCHDILVGEPNAVSKPYEIDPDGTGPMGPVTVTI